MATEWTAQEEQVYQALSMAAGRVAANDFAQQCREYRGPKRRFQYNPCQALRDLVDGMKQLGQRQVTPEQAMSLLSSHDVDMLRFGGRALS